MLPQSQQKAHEKTRCVRGEHHASETPPPASLLVSDQSSKPPRLLASEHTRDFRDPLVAIAHGTPSAVSVASNSRALGSGRTSSTGRSQAALPRP